MLILSNATSNLLTIARLILRGTGLYMGTMRCTFQSELISSWRLLWRFNNAAKKKFGGLLVWKVPKCLNSMFLTLHSAILWHCIVDSWVAVHSSSKMGKCQNTSYWLQLLVINSIFVLSMLTFGVNPIEMSPEVEEAFDPDSEEDSYQRFSY